jgi:four helix bundle protein
MRPSIRSYRDLKVWQRGIILAETSYRLSQRLPTEERFGLVVQIRKAAVSIPANVAEGHGRAHLGDYLRFLSIAKGSLMELETHVVWAERLRYVNRQDTAALFTQSAEVGRMLAGLISALRRRKYPQRNQPSAPDP